MAAPYIYFFPSRFPKRISKGNFVTRSECNDQIIIHNSFKKLIVFSVYTKPELKITLNGFHI